LQNINDHIIKKQSVAIEFRDRQEGMGLQNKIADLVKDKIIPQLDEVFSEIAGPGKYLSLDELLIDAGTLNAAHWEEELVINTMRQVKEKLRTESPYIISRQITGSDAVGPNTISDWEAFFHFLEFGYLPWYAANIPLAELEERVLVHLKQSSNKITELQQKLSAEKNILLRFIFQFSASFTEEVIDSIAIDKQKTRAGEKLIYSFNFLSVDTRQQLILLFRLFYAAAAGEIKYLQSAALKEAAAINSTPSVYRLIKKELIPVRAFTPARVLVELMEEALRYDHAKVVPSVDLLFESVIPEISVKKNGSGYSSERPELPSETDTKRAETKQEKTSLPQKERNESKKEEAYNQGIFVSNAGLIILHPFLAGLFRELKLTNENNEWLQPSFQARAVLITQYLITGMEETDEHLLVLNKLLCGYSSEDTLERHLILTDEEKKEIASLLQTVITYWEALKNTTIEGLRNTFLLRDGKLTINENGWLLQIEQKAWDVLLDTLPWGTSMIKTPWMNELLRVQWG